MFILIQIEFHHTIKIENIRFLPLFIRNINKRRKIENDEEMNIQYLNKKSILYHVSRERENDKNSWNKRIF